MVIKAEPNGITEEERVKASRIYRIRRMQQLIIALTQAEGALQAAHGVARGGTECSDDIAFIRRQVARLLGEVGAALDTARDEESGEGS